MYSVVFLPIICFSVLNSCFESLTSYIYDDVNFIFCLSVLNNTPNSVTSLFICLLLFRSFSTTAWGFSTMLYFSLIASLLYYTFSVEHLSVLEFHLTLKNTLLSNSINKIHPPLLYMSVASLAIFLMEYFAIRSYTFRMLKTPLSFNFLFTETHPMLLKPNTSSIFILTLVLVLGAWWAFQISTWGGWWVWDESEILLLFIILPYVVLSHLRFVKHLTTHILKLITFLLTMVIAYSLYSQLLLSGTLHTFYSSSLILYDVSYSLKLLTLVVLTCYLMRFRSKFLLLKLNVVPPSVKYVTACSLTASFSFLLTNSFFFWESGIWSLYFLFLLVSSLNFLSFFKNFNLGIATHVIVILLLLNTLFQNTLLDQSGVFISLTQDASLSSNIATDSAPSITSSVYAEVSAINVSKTLLGQKTISESNFFFYNGYWSTIPYPIVALPGDLYTLHAFNSYEDLIIFY